MRKRKPKPTNTFKDPTAKSKWSLPGRYEKQLINMSLEEMIKRSTIASKETKHESN